MNLFETLTQIAEHFGLKADDLISYANEDTIGGFNTDATKSRWPVGSIWDVEGKTLYALVRALKPRRLLLFGVGHGCAATHCAEAMRKNDNGGTLVCVAASIDQALTLATTYSDSLSLVEMPYVEFVAEPTDAQFDFIFEDSERSAGQVEMLWRYAVAHMVSGLIVSHDAMHYLVGEHVRRGIESVVGDKAHYYLTEPSDCGLVIYRHQRELPLQVEEESEPVGSWIPEHTGYRPAAPAYFHDVSKPSEPAEHSEPAPRRKRTRKAKANG